MFQALALHQSEKAALKLFMVANFRYQLSW